MSLEGIKVGSGIDKLSRILKEKKTVVKKAFFWKIPHNSGKDDIRLKIGRYKKNLGFGFPRVKDIPDDDELSF